jgi:hypothetical protein
MSYERYKLLVRNLRTKAYEKLKFQAAISDVKFGKVRESVQVRRPTKSDNGKGQ